MLPNRPPQPGLETNSPSLQQTQGDSTKPPEPSCSALCSPRSEKQNDLELLLDSRHLHIAGSTARPVAYHLAVTGRLGAVSCVTDGHRRSVTPRPSLLRLSPGAQSEDVRVGNGLVSGLPTPAETPQSLVSRESDDPELFLHASPTPLVEAATASPLGFRVDADSGHASLTCRILGWGQSTGRDVAPDCPHRDVEPFGGVELAHPFRIRRRDDAPSHRSRIALVLALHRPTVHALPISIKPPHATSLPGRDPFRGPEIPLQGTRRHAYDLSLTIRSR